MFQVEEDDDNAQNDDPNDYDDDDDDGDGDDDDDSVLEFVDASSDQGELFKNIVFAPVSVTSFK